jgi:hypothetical protein
MLVCWWTERAESIIPPLNGQGRKSHGHKTPTARYTTLVILFRIVTFRCVTQAPIGLQVKEFPKGAAIRGVVEFSDQCQSTTNCRLHGGFLTIPTGFLLHSSKDLATGWKLVSSFMREIEVMHLGLFFDILADGCIMGGGVGYGMRKLSPIHINKPSNAYL